MKPVRLEIAGLRSWRAQREVRFDNVDLGAVVGDTGAGKSSILEAIVYALYNATSYDKTNVASLISSDIKTMSVVFDFEANGEVWRVTRSRSRANYPPSVHKIACLSNPAAHPMVEGEGPVNDAVKDLIGLDVNQFQTAVLLPQGRFQLLLMATAAVRSAILKGVFRLDELDEVKLKAARVRRDLVEPSLDAKIAERSELFTDPEAELGQATDDLAQAHGVISKLEEHKAEYESTQKVADELAATISQMMERAEALRMGAIGLAQLDPLLELEAEIATEESETQKARAGLVDARDGAQRLVDEAAARGVTVEILARARQILQTAREKLPALDADAEALEAARLTFDEQREALQQEQAKYEQELIGLDARDSTVAELRKTAGAAAAFLTGATDALRDLRTAQTQTADAQRAFAEQEASSAQLRGEAERAATEAQAAESSVAGAEEVYEAVRRAHEAAHLAAGLKPGEKCPVCSHELPGDFKAPKPSSALSTAEEKARELRQAAQKAAEKAAAAQGLATNAVEVLKARHQDALSAAAALAEKTSTASAFLQSADLALADEVLLEEVTSRAAGAASALAEAEQALVADRARLETTSKSLQEKSDGAVSREQELVRDDERIKRERQAQREALDSLPAEYQLENTGASAFEAVLKASAERLAELQGWQEQARAATAAIHGADATVAALAKRRNDEIDIPRREAVMHARDLALLVVNGTKKRLQDQPGDAAPLAKHSEWVNRVGSVAIETADAIDAEAVTKQRKRDEAQRASERILAVAGQLVEEELATPKALSDQLDGWRARSLMAQETKDKASAQIPHAASLDQALAALRRRRESLEEVARLLGDGHFVKWLVERRQQLLLAVASDILAGMTGSRYRFAADFTVIDGRTGIARKPNTLSGGESFMASLSLALGMAEIAARSGGRIGSLYLDEGFGALDPNALDEAINALEARARSGQMILIVSHVPAIAQRIERVLKVIPDPEGSRAEWLDDADREALLVEAAAAEM